MAARWLQIFWLSPTSIFTCRAFSPSIYVSFLIFLSVEQSMQPSLSQNAASWDIKQSITMAKQKRNESCTRVLRSFSSAALSLSPFTSCLRLSFFFFCKVSPSALQLQMKCTTLFPSAAVFSTLLSPPMASQWQWGGDTTAPLALSPCIQAELAYQLREKEKKSSGGTRPTTPCLSQRRNAKKKKRKWQEDHNKGEERRETHR